MTMAIWIPGPNIGLFQRGMFPGVPPLDPVDSTDPRGHGPWRDQQLAQHSVSISNLGLMTAWRAGRFGLCLSACSSTGKTSFSRHNLCSACCCLPRQRPVGGVEIQKKKNTVEREKNKISIQNGTNTTLRRLWKDRDTVYITGKNEEPTYTRVIWHNLKRETTTTQRHIRQQGDPLFLFSLLQSSLLAVDSGHWAVLSWAHGDSYTSTHTHMHSCTREYVKFTHSTFGFMIHLANVCPAENRFR